MFKRCCGSKTIEERLIDDSLIRIELLTFVGKKTTIKIKYGTPLKHLQRVIKEKYRLINTSVGVDNQWTFSLRIKKIEPPTSSWTSSWMCCTSEPTIGEFIEQTLKSTINDATTTKIWLIFQPRKASARDIPPSLPVSNLHAPHPLTF